jgi:hypothetical protein
VTQEAERTVALPAANGDLVIEARWEGGGDLDVGVVDGKGIRLSLLGGRRGLSVVDATSTAHERLALRFLPVGGLMVEIARKSPLAEAGAVRGELVVRALGQSRVVPFVLDGPQATVARVDVRQVEVVSPWF